VKTSPLSKHECAAKETLLNYTEQKGALERDRHRRLVACVKKSEAEFLAAFRDSS
jgi:hypothetical protein